MNKSYKFHTYDWRYSLDVDELKQALLELEIPAYFYEVETIPDCTELVISNYEMTQDELRKAYARS